MGKPIKHIVSLSGGKDSTAMLLRMLEEGMPVDIILFCDTGLEFEGMYHHIDKLEKYIGMPITRLKSAQPFEYLFFEHMQSSALHFHEMIQFRQNPPPLIMSGFLKRKTRLINPQDSLYTIVKYLQLKQTVQKPDVVLCYLSVAKF